MKKLISLLLAVMMVMALCACGGGSESAAPAADAPAAAPAAPAADGAPAAEAPADGQPSGEPTGDPVAELFPADGYSKDVDGYKEYAIDALKSDEHAPPEIIDSTVEAIQQAADGYDETFDMLINQGRILSYDEFIAG